MNPVIIVAVVAFIFIIAIISLLFRIWLLTQAAENIEKPGTSSKLLGVGEAGLALLGRY